MVDFAGQEMSPKKVEAEQNLAAPYSNAGSDIIKWQLDIRDVLREIEFKLKGIVWDSIEGKFVQKRTPIANDEGINMIMTIIEARINKGIILSNLEDYEVRAIQLDCISNVIDLLFMQYRIMGIKKEHLSIIRGIIDDGIFAALKRAQDEGEREFLKTTERRIESYVDRAEPKQKKGLMNLFKF